MRTGRRLWTWDASARTVCGPSIVNGRVLRGYGFTLFSGPGPGGVISFVLGRRERGQARGYAPSRPRQASLRVGSSGKVSTSLTKKDTT